MLEQLDQLGRRESRLFQNFLSHGSSLPVHAIGEGGYIGARHVVNGGHFVVVDHLGQRAGQRRTARIGGVPGAVGPNEGAGALQAFH